MRIFVYEFVTAGGLWSLGDAPPAGSLLMEGLAMAAAVAADFRKAGHDVRRLHDVRLPQGAEIDAVPIASAGGERSQFLRLASNADRTIVIAPESDGMLLKRCQWVSECGGRLCSPSAELIALTSDKCRTADHLRRQGVPTPRGIRIEPGEAPSLVAGERFPAVLKPIDGCGSQGVRLVANAAELGAAAIGRTMRLERFIPGQAASVAVLCGPNQILPLPACQQRVSSDGCFSYLGGRLPLSAELDRRARRLAVAAVKALPAPLGYIGVDLVLGEDSDGRGDCAIEINPRLTTSYVGLRALCAGNLAAAMIDVANGVEPSLSWRGGRVEFAADGTVAMTSGKSQGDPAR
jgi:predicted ATP-grasp superfamily ATP-dependent carboligase